MRARWTVIVAAFALVLAGVVYLKQTTATAPFGPESLNVVAEVRFVDWQEARTEVPNLPRPGNGDQLMLGHLSWRPPNIEHDGSFEILLIDQRSHHKPNLVIGNTADAQGVWCCAGPVLYQVESKYEWLRGAGDPRDGDTSYSSMSSVSVLPRAGEVTIVALFRSQAGEGNEDYRKHWAAAPIAGADLLLAIVYLGPNQTIYWAHKITQAT